MTIYTGEADVRPLQGIGSLTSSIGEELGASAGEAFASLPTHQLFDLDEIAATKPMTAEDAAISGIAPVQSADVPIADAREQVKASGLPIKLPEQDTIRQATLDIMVQHARDERERQATLARGPGGFIRGALDIGTSLFVGALDPLGVAAFAIPVLGEARYGKLIADVGSTFFERAAGGLAIGAEKGAVGSLVLAPLEYAAKTQEGQDFGMADILRNAMYSAGTMALLHTGAVEGGLLFGAKVSAPAALVADLPPRAKEDLLRGAVASIIEDKPVQAAEHIAAAGDDPRIAETLGERLRGQLGLIDNTHDVVSGANSSRDPNGPVYIDKNIPEFSPELKDASGQPANLHKYLAVHERTEAEAMARGASYDEAHTKIATPAERAAVEADGVDWKAYTHEIDGYLAKIEHEKVSNPPPDTHVDPQEAIGHHRAENKETAPTPEAYRGVKAGGATVLLSPRQAAADEAWRALSEAKPSHEGPAAIEKSRAAQAAPEPESVATEIQPARQPAAPRPSARPAARGPRARPEEAWSLLEFLADRGGINPNDPLISDLRGSIGRSNKFIPGFGHIIRKSGMSLDRAREAAVEAGYIYDLGAISGRATHTNVNTLLEAMDNELRGARVYRHGREPERVVENDQYAERELAAALREIGEEPAKIASPLWQRTLEIMEREGERDPLTAYDRAVMEEDLHGTEAGELVEPRTEGIPGWDDNNVGSAAPSESRAIAQAGHAEGAGGGESSRAGGENDRRSRPQSASAAALEKAAAEADAEWAAIEPYLSDEERAQFNDLLQRLDQDALEREEMVKRGSACMAMATA